MRSMEEMFGLTGTIALVTGGYGHLGTAIVEALAAAGAAVGVAGRSTEKAERLCVMLRQRSPEVTVMPVEMDVTDSRSIKIGLDSVEREIGGVTLLVNNAARALPARPENITDDRWREGIAAALDSAFMCMRQAAGRIEAAGGGSIVNIASMYGIVSPDFRVYEDAESYLSPASYGAAKAALLQLTRYLAVYYAKAGIRVNAISPGAFPSSTRAEDQPFISQLVARVPMGRIGHPRDVGPAVVFLASDAAAYVTGHNLVIDGGWTIT